MNKSKLTDSLTNKPESLPQPPTNASGSPVSTNTKGNGEKSELATSDGKSGQVLAPKQEAFKLLEKLLKQKTPSTENLNHLHNLIVSTPDAWWLASLGMPPCWSSVIEKTDSDLAKTLIRADMDIMKKKMDYDSSSALEQMHIDHVLTAQLRLRNAEQNFNSKILGGEGFSFEGGRFWQDFLESAQLRFQRASESLAKIRRLARMTPALQINIAQAGSKQVNVQGEVKGQKVTSAPDAHLITQETPQ